MLAGWAKSRIRKDAHPTTVFPSPDASEAWSSLSHMRLIVSLEKQLGRRRVPKEIVSVISANAVEALLSKGPAHVRTGDT
ncbi:hypothetical protein [Roseobacter sp.]|uniref:hypothetical protein n=1 Tax=Roseobacter sp. TaxID=1907202 RepID=UPI0029665D7E|nr:hypothetical protein [Roseobacter sp.]MDW3182603.1 hypothetical protein [Roseobacter sp.]